MRFLIYSYFIFLPLLTIGQIKPVWNEYKEIDGMVSNYIYDIKEDKQGLLWLATENGLVKFDGYHASLALEPDSLGRHTPVYFVYIMPDDRLWLGTKGGLKIYDTKTQTSVDHSLVFDKPIEDIIYLGDKKALISYLYGVYVVSVDDNFHPLSYEVYDVKHFGENLIINEFLVHDNKELFISLAGHGIIKGDIEAIGQWDKFSLINNPFKDQKKEFTVGKNLQHLPSQQILINYMNEGPFLYDLTAGKLKKVDGINLGEIPTVRPYSAATYADGYLYFSVTGMGMYRILINKKNATLESISLESIPDFNFLDDGVSSLYVKNNTLWAATVGDGLKSTYIPGEGLETIVLHQYIGNLTSLYSVKPDAHGGLLIGTFGKGVIYLSRKGNNRHFDLSSAGKNSKRLNLPCDSISEIHFDRQENLWIATYDGLCYFTKEQYRQFREGKSITPRVYSTRDDDPFSSDVVNDVFEDTRGNIYATTNDGLNKIELKKDIVINHRDTLAKGVFQLDKPMYYGDFLSDSSIVLFSPWVNGLVKDGLFSSHESLFPDSYGVYVFHSVVANEGTNWLATNKGLYKYNSKTGKTIEFKERPFFKNKKINAITEDYGGTLWMGTNQGIFSFHPKSGRINQYRVPGASGWPFFHYGSVGKDDLGNIYFGTNKGVVIINTKRIDREDHKCSAPCDIIISDVLINDKRRKINIPEDGSTTVIKIKENDVVDVLLGFPAHHRHDGIQFEYSINGEKWFQADPVNPHISLHHLSPGEYNVEVRVIRYGGEIITASAIPFEVDGPWWKAWWAFVIYSLMAGSIVAGYYRYRLAGVRLKQQLELEKVARINQNLKLDFVSNISHEFRTPLTLMLNDIDTLKSNGKLSNPKQLDKIEVNAQRLKRLANELIDIKKLEKEGLKLMVAQHDIISFVRDTAQVFEELARKSHIDLKFETNKKFELVWFNKDQLEKVLFNLLSNAFKFTPENGSITVSIDCQYFNEEREAVRITVKDSGVGIAGNNLEKVFDASFSQPPLNQASGFESTGIGLHLSQKLVNMHHGQIAVESKKGEGSAFSLFLYKGSSHFKEDQLVKFRLQHHLKRSLLRFNKEFKENISIKVLVVEDNKDIRKYMCGILSEYYTVIEAKSGIDGTELAKTRLPDLIITDLSMPGKSGHALIREIREDEMTSHIPIIVLTAFASDAKKVEVLTAGADLHLAKPCDKSVLLASAQNLIRSRANLKAMFSDSMANIDEVAHSSPDSDLLKRAMVIVNKNMADPYFDVADLADKLKVSRSLLYLKFPALTNYSPKEFIHVMRVRKGAKLLKSGRYNINEASDEIGYNSVKNFRKYFKSYFGISPSEFLRNHKVKD